MRSRRGGYVLTRHSHHPARLRGHPSSGRRGIHFVRRFKELLGHKDVSTTMIYTHVLNLAKGVYRTDVRETPGVLSR